MPGVEPGMASAGPSALGSTGSGSAFPLQRPSPGNRVYTAERILKRRQRPRTGAIEYLVKWQGFSDEEATWEPRKNILSKQLIDDFENAHKKRKVDRDDSGDLHEVWLTRRKLDGQSRFGLELIEIIDKDSGQSWCSVLNTVVPDEPIQRGDVLKVVDGTAVESLPFSEVLAKFQESHGTLYCIFQRDD